MKTPQHIVIFDVGGVLAKNTYNEMIEDLLANSDKSIISNTLAVASGLFKIYKVGDITEDEFFFSLLKKQPSFQQELVKLKYVNPESSVDDVVMFLKKRLRSHHLCIFPSHHLFFDTQHVTIQAILTALHLIQHYILDL